MALAATAYSGVAEAADPSGTQVLTTETANGGVFWGLAVSAGRIVWTGNGPGTPVSKRSLTSNGTAVLAGAPTEIGHSDAAAIQRQDRVLSEGSSSGNRTLWAQRVGSTNHLRLNLTTGTTTKQISGNAIPVKLSGTRALYKRLADEHYVLYDITDGTYFDVTTAYHPRVNSTANGFTVDLFGNSLVFATPDFRIWRKNLSDSAEPRLVIGVNPPERLMGIAVFAYGDWVGWNRFYGYSDGFDSYAECGFRDARYKYTIIPSSCMKGLSSAGAIIDKSDSGSHTWFLHPFSSLDEDPLPVSTSTYDLGVNAGVLAWADSDGLKAAPFDDGLGYYPRSLGNPHAPKSFTAPAHTWSFELVAADPLTTCTVTFTRGGTTYRTLPCNPSVLPQGVITVRWDGRATNGNVVPAGTYTWTVNAGNGVGMLRSDGVLKPTTGQVTVVR